MTTDNELTKDDLYEIEKICDVYAGWITDNLRSCCDIAFKYSTIKHDTPLDDNILSLQEARDRVKKIRAKLENLRTARK